MATLPFNSAERKEYPLFSGALRYFPAALAGVARNSKRGNDKHSPDSNELVWDRSKSDDHGDCLLRHLVDLNDELATFPINGNRVLEEADAIAWRALALSQSLYEIYGSAPLAPAVKSEDDSEKIAAQVALRAWEEANADY